MDPFAKYPGLKERLREHVCQNPDLFTQEENDYWREREAQLKFPVKRTQPPLKIHTDWSTTNPDISLCIWGSRHTLSG